MLTSLNRYALLTLLTATTLLACGGGGDSGSGMPNPQPQRMTRFTGNVQAASPSLAAGDANQAGGAAGLPVQVCVAGTSFCTVVSDNGTFVLDASVGGDVVLVFDGPNFTAQLGLSNVPRGATVRIVNIVCSTVTGRCEAADVQIVAPFNAPPICDDAVANPAVLWPPNHRMVRIGIRGVVDPDGDPVFITATDVFSDEPDDAPGSGNTAPDAQLDPLAVRAERSGQGDGRIYEIEFVADDGRGGTCAGIVHVCVPHDQGQGRGCQ